MQHMLFGLLLAVSTAEATVAQEAKPTKATGILIAGSSTLLFADQIPEFKGNGLEIRTIVLEPGEMSAYHSHANRPIVAYLASGDYTEHRNDEGVIVHEIGEQWTEGANVAHWSKNRGSVSTYLINVEVVRLDE